MTQRQAKELDLETRQRHAHNVQAACQKLETFTLALDQLIDQIESEMNHQSQSIKPL